MTTTRSSNFAATIRTTLLLGGLTGLLVVIGALIGGPDTALIFLVVAAVMNLGVYWFSDRIALATARAKPISEQEAPQIYAMVRELTTAAKMPMPRIYLIPQAQPNAFATGRSPEKAAVAVTAGITQLLSPDELRGVIAHELAHIRNRDTLIQSVAAAIGGAISYLGYMLRWFGGDDNSYASIAFGTEGSFTLPFKSTLTFRGSYLPAIDDWANNYLLRGEAALMFPMTDWLAFRSGVLSTYTSQPAEDTQDYSVTGTAGLALVF